MARAVGSPQRSGEDRQTPRASVWLGLVVVLTVFCLLPEAKLWRPDALFVTKNNPQIGEAQAWWQGRTDLAERQWDTALKDGRVYSHFPPMFSLLAAAVVPLFQGFPHWLIVLLVALPIPILAYGLFVKRTGSPRWAALLAIGLVFGTSLYPVLEYTIRGAKPYMTNHALATVGLLIFMIEWSGRRRVWLGGLGLVVSALSRQLTSAYLLPLAIMAWRVDPARRMGRLVALCVVGLVVVLLPMVLNTIKFGHPLDSGYMYVYADRDEDSFSRDARTYGIFSAHYVPRNLYYTNVGFPRVHRITMEGVEELHLRPNLKGTGIWWTTPLLLWLVIDIRRILRNGEDRWLLVAVGLAFCALMFYHSTGYVQRGFNRYSLDYLPVLLALVTPGCLEGRRRWISLAMVAWGVAYFRWLI